jgi:hypothetical protein
VARAGEPKSTDTAMRFPARPFPSAAQAENVRHMVGDGQPTQRHSQNDAIRYPVCRERVAEADTRLFPIQESRDRPPSPRHPKGEGGG